MSRRPVAAWKWGALVAGVVFVSSASASIGDRLPEFKECVKVCIQSNCASSTPPSIPLQRRLLLWDCPSECDYTCQHLTTEERLSRDPPYLHPIVQFHGKWPFYRFLGMQEPFSVIFSLLNYLAHSWGMAKLREMVPASYPLRKYYMGFGYFGLASWIFSMIFHTRDFRVTEKLDYFAAGASVLYGMYYAAVRIFRLDERTPRKRSVLRAWTVMCALLYTAHVMYLTLWSWDYTYNMAANVACGIVQNIMWSWFSVMRYKKLQRTWAAWPGLIVAWLIMAMSLELLDFPPWGGMIDAHSLWHLGTVVPTIWWYNFLIKDAQQDIQGTRLKA
ncbi:Mn2+ homeostasis protein [Aulographum hederae CBS 113979]|uniref:Post-GPI attachment to proteins factor 3 n=1 Tax=Aulographum hederae CBS 113979 TaxID=1176131 RepID=A0A6G1H2W8_9PEZI|nr:Mn2+ homeostasis protein [Aulographum hederae CBS 113979]